MIPAADAEQITGYSEAIDADLNGLAEPDLLPIQESHNLSPTWVQNPPNRAQKDLTTANERLSGPTR